MNSGSRCIVVAAGSYKHGLISKSVVVVRGAKDKTSNKDYHSEMNADFYYKYCNETLFPLIKGKRADPTVFVIDRATYHRSATAESKYPARSGPNYLKRDDLLAWMEKRKLCHPASNEKATMAMLHEYIRKTWKQVGAIE